MDTIIFIDESATEATRNRGGRFYTKYKAEEAHISAAAGNNSTNFTAEATALHVAATEILSDLDKTYEKNAFHFLTLFQCLMFFRTLKRKN